MDRIIESAMKAGFQSLLLLIRKKNTMSKKEFEKFLNDPGNKQLKDVYRLWRQAKRKDEKEINKKLAQVKP